MHQEVPRAAARPVAAHVATAVEAAQTAKMSAEGLQAWFGANRVLHGIDMEIPAHGVTAIIGPSGCGKSTFIRCLNRMHEVISIARMEGRVLLEGEDVYSRGVDPVMLRRRVGMVFQKPNPFPTMSIRDNVLAGLRLTHRLDRSRADEICERALRQAALWDEVKDRLDAPGAGLSGGQQQRLCIARSLAVDPEVLLMDEPCSALDPVATARIEDLIHSLKTDYTIVIVTHNMQQAARVSDMTAFYSVEVNETSDTRTGILVEYDLTERMFSNPSDERTERYVTGRFG
jgi:phosphate transport system ATP-binding protein